MRLVSNGTPVAAALNLTLTMAGGVVAGWMGLIAGRALVGQ
jgi:hypothetical protein